MSTVDLNSQLFPRFTNQIIASLERGVVPWRKPWSIYGPPMDLLTKQPYPGVNLWLLNALEHASNLYVSGAQLAEIGGTVEHLQQGHVIIAGTTHQPGYEIVFSVDQCRGIPQTLLRQRPVELYPVVNACAALIATMRNRPEMQTDGDCMCYSAAEDVIYLSRRPSHQSPEQYYQMLFHQMIHYTGHPQRLDRSTVHLMAEFGNDPCSYEELVAELGTGYLCSFLQVTGMLRPPTPEYVGRWLEKLRADKKMLVHASDDAQRAVDYLLQGNPVAALIRCT